MAYWKDESCFCINSELDLFEVPPLNVSATSSYYVETTPVNSITADGPIEFTVSQDAHAFTNLSQSYLELKCKVLKSDNTAPAAANEGVYPDESKVFPVNYFGGAMFKNVEVLVNQKNVSHANDLYPYKSFIEYVLTYDEATKEEQGALAFFYKDTGTFDDTTTLNTATNKGAFSRWELTRCGKEFEVFTKIHNDFFSQNKLLPGDIPLSIKFHRKESKFCLMGRLTTQAYKVTIESAILQVKKIRVSDAYLQSLRRERQLQKFIRYPMKRIEMQYKTHSANLTELQNLRLISNGPIPKRIIIGLVDSRGFDGHYNHNPFKFENFGVTSIKLTKETDKLPFQEMKLNYPNHMYKKAYLALAYGTGRLFKNTTMGITPKEFAEGMALYCFDLAKNGADLPTFELAENGTIGVTISLSEAHDHSIVSVYYLEHDYILSIAPNDEPQIN